MLICSSHLSNGDSGIRKRSRSQHQVLIRRTGLRNRVWRGLRAEWVRLSHETSLSHGRLRFQKPCSAGFNHQAYQGNHVLLAERLLRNLCPVPAVRNRPALLEVQRLRCPVHWRSVWENRRGIVGNEGLWFYSETACLSSTCWSWIVILSSNLLTGIKLNHLYEYITFSFTIVLMF